MSPELPSRYMYCQSTWNGKIISWDAFDYTEDIPYEDVEEMPCVIYGADYDMNEYRCTGKVINGHVTPDEDTIELTITMEDIDDDDEWEDENEDCF